MTDCRCAASNHSITRKENLMRVVEVTVLAVAPHGQQ
jgi:hypothetical protein